MPLPPSTDDPVAADIKIDLVELDSEVAGVVTSLIAGRALSAGEIDRLIQKCGDLRGRAERLTQSDPQEATKVEAEFVQYLNLLENLLNESKAVVADRAEA